MMQNISRNSGGTSCKLAPAGEFAQGIYFAKIVSLVGESKTEKLIILK
jgi:hypothetical protein